MSQDSRPRDAQANLDTLRAFAVSAVILDHWSAMTASRFGREGHWDALGNAGVIAFFVHTSLVLMFSLRRMTAAPDHLVSRFYVRRLFRIYPLAIAAVLIVLAFRIPPMPTLGATFREPGRLLVVANLLLVQNVIGHESILGPLWSLPFEVQMYAVLPPLFAVTRSRRALTAVAVVFVTSLITGVTIERATGHSNILASVPCFVSGVLAYVLQGRVAPRIPSLLWIPALLLWFEAYLLFAPRDPARQIAFQGLMSAALALAIVGHREMTSGWWNQLAERVARYSYGIYLMHFPALWVVRDFWAGTPALGPVAWLALTLALSVMSYHLLEAPMIDLGRRLTDASTRLAPPERSLSVEPS